MVKLASNQSAVIAAIHKLNEILPDSPQLIARLGMAHAFYVADTDADKPLFGFSKFVGYEGLDAEAYVSNYDELHGSNTEHAMSAWFDELPYGSASYMHYRSFLDAWLGQFGKRAREGVEQKPRIMVPKPVAFPRDDQHDKERDLLELLIKVSGMLPNALRRELKASL